VLFNSVEFLFLFLPVLLVVYFRLGRVNVGWAASWLTACSLFFYAWWNPVYVGLLLISIAFNYTIGYALAQGDDVGSTRRKRLLALGVGVDLALLGYYKYADFCIDAVNQVSGSNYPLMGILLPLGISFFTFTQIAFLVDAAQGKAREFNPVHYALFVTYFPHLIAGPVLHHKEMMPQFVRASSYRFQIENITAGLTVFALGLFKKVVLADGVAPYATLVFKAVEQGESIGLFQSWGGVLAYTLQLYFDFSGYCDMAIGLSFMLGIRLPLNFNSPYKAANIADFWRRWHMTLSRFLRDYLYIPLGGNRNGLAARYVNLTITMLLGGLWHGAGWTFVVWGGLHGLYLVLHQIWQALCVRLGWDKRPSTRAGRSVAIGLTFLSVVVAWVFFRAATLNGALTLLWAMLGNHGISMPEGLGLRLGSLTPWLIAQGITFTPGGGRDFVMTFLWVAALLPMVFFAPNTQQVMGHFKPALDQDAGDSLHWQWQPRRGWVVVMTLVLASGLMMLSRPSEFLYFQF
jgi:alginate O-acetyltransferase complex protein AlgI